MQEYRSVKPRASVAKGQRRIAARRRVAHHHTRLPTIPDDRLRYLAAHIHALGPRPLFELLRELAHGAPLGRSLERYARLYRLKDFIAELGGRELPQPRIIGGG
jgi:hypothetical protein